MTTLAQLARLSGAEFRHWGDADVGGLRIWWLLRSRLDRPVSLLRTTAAWVRSESLSGGRLLSPAEQQALLRLRTDLSRATGADIEPALALVDVLLEQGIKLEQERY